MTSLLATAVHFLILTQWLTQQVTIRVQPADSCELDMAINAFDDQYVGCTEEMEAKAPQLLQEEFKVNRNLKAQWEDAAKEWEEKKHKIDSPKGFSDSHGTALVAYTGDIAVEFNEAVRNFRKNPNKFQFLAFHYYLTRALQLLKSEKVPCYTVYRGCKTKFGYSGKGNVRFGQFTSSSLSKNVAMNFAGSSKRTLFTIRTCLGVEIKMFSYYPFEEEVLIPGYEVYQVVDNQHIDKNYNCISLTTTNVSKSNYSCFYINSSGTKGSSLLYWLLPVLLVLLLLFAVILFFLVRGSEWGQECRDISPNVAYVSAHNPQDI